MPPHADGTDGDDMSRPELSEPKAQPRLGATHEANAGNAKFSGVVEIGVPKHIPTISWDRLDTRGMSPEALAKVKQKYGERGMPYIRGGDESGLDLEKLLEAFGAQRDTFRRNYLTLQRPDLSIERKRQLLGARAQLVDEVATTADTGEPLAEFDWERLTTKEQIAKAVTLHKIQVQMQLAMAAFGATVNYEDQTALKVAQGNPEGSAQHDSPVMKLFQLVATGASIDAILEAEQAVQQFAGVDNRESFAGTQARFYVWLKGRSGAQYQGYLPLTAFMDKIDTPEWSRKFMSKPWADERKVARPGDTRSPEGWKKSTYLPGYVPEIGNLINELLRERLGVPDDEVIESSNLWHPLMSTRIDTDTLAREDVRDEVIDNLFSHFLAGFTFLRLFGRDRAWDKTLSGRVVDAFRKGLNPQTYFEQLYGLPPEGRGPIFLLTMYYDIWSEKFDNLFPWDRINFNADGDSRPLAEARKDVQRGGGEWYESWDQYSSVAEIQKKILETKTRREGVAASEVWRESLLVLGLATRDVNKAVLIYEKTLKDEKLDPSKRQDKAKQFRQYVTRLSQMNPYGFEAYRKQVGNGATEAGYRAWVGKKATGFVYDPKVAMAKPGEMRSFGEMADAYWTPAEEALMKDVDVEGVFYQWGKSEAWVAETKQKYGANVFKGPEAVKWMLRAMSYDNFDYQRMGKDHAKKWHDYVASATATSNSLIPATQVIVARESVEDILEKSSGQGAIFSDEVIKGFFDKYFLAQLKEATGSIEKTFNYFPRSFKAHVAKEFVLVLARLSCKLRDDQWHTVMDREVTTDGAGWHERYLGSQFLAKEDKDLLQKLGFQFQGKSAYGRNGYPVAWQAQGAQMGLASPDLGEQREGFVTPIQAMYGGRVLGWELFQKFARNIIGDLVFADAKDVNAVLADLDAIVDMNPKYQHTAMTPEEMKIVKAVGSMGAGILTGLSDAIRPK